MADDIAGFGGINMNSFGTPWGPSFGGGGGGGGSGGEFGGVGSAYGADKSSAASRYAAQQQAEASKYGANLQYQNAQNQLALQQAKFGFAKNQYAQLFPLISGAVGNYGSGGGSQLGYQGGGGGGGSYQAPAIPSTPSYGSGNESLPQAPTIQALSIPKGPGAMPYSNFATSVPSYQQGGHDVLNSGQIQQQVNQQQAQNDASAAGASTRAIQGAGGRGVGATSPLARALQNQIFGSNLIANSNASSQTRLNAAQLNAQNNQSYDLANLQSATALGAAGIAGQASEYGSAQNALTGQYASQLGALSSAYGSQLGAQSSEYGTQVDALTSLRNAATAAQSSNYNAQLGYNSSTYGDQLGYQGQLAAVQASKQNALIQALSGMLGNV